jgi:dipeptidyl aminopeptidase/acylaminoacyl peptidase
MDISKTGIYGWSAGGQNAMAALQIVNVLVKAGKNFEQLCLPGKGHSLGSKFEMRRLNDFFVKHLKGQEPPER